MASQVAAALTRQASSDGVFGIRPIAERRSGLATSGRQPSAVVMASIRETVRRTAAPSLPDPEDVFWRRGCRDPQPARSCSPDREVRVHRARNRPPPGRFRDPSITKAPSPAASSPSPDDERTFRDRVVDFD